MSLSSLFGVSGAAAAAAAAGAVRPASSQLRKRPRTANQSQTAQALNVALPITSTSDNESKQSLAPASRSHSSAARAHFQHQLSLSVEDAASERLDAEDAAGNRKKRKMVLTDHSKDPRLSRTIFVGNVPTQCTERELRQWLCREHHCGSIESVRFRSVSVSNPNMPKRSAVITKSFHQGRDNMNAYVVFKDESSVTTALALNGQELQSHHLRIDRADHTTVTNDETFRSVFIGNLSPTTNEEQLHAHFTNCGEIVSVRIVRDKVYKISKCVAFIQFKEASAVRIAVTLNETTLDGRPLRVTRSKTEAQLEKIKAREGKTAAPTEQMHPAARRLVAMGKLSADDASFMGNFTSRKDVKHDEQAKALRTARRKNKKIQKQAQRREERSRSKAPGQRTAKGKTTR